MKKTVCFFFFFSLFAFSQAVEPVPQEVFDALALYEGEEIDLIKKTLEESKDINAQFNLSTWSTDDTALTTSVKHNYIEVSKALINAGADVNIQNDYGSTALMDAVIQGNADLVSYLLRAGADVNIQNDYGWTALIEASYRNKTDIVKILVDNNADVNIQHEYGWTALMIVSDAGNTEIVKLLLESGNVIDTQNSLMIALDEDKTDIVKLLVDRGADVLMRNKYGYNALTYAIEKEYVEIITILQTSIKNNLDNTTISYTDLARFPEKNKGQRVVFEGEVSNVWKENDYKTVTLSFYDDKRHKRDITIVVYNNLQNWEVIEYDTIIVYGTANGTDEYFENPIIIADYIELLE